MNRISLHLGPTYFPTVDRREASSDWITKIVRKMKWTGQQVK